MNNTMTINGCGNSQLYVNTWMPQNKPVAALQILHGLGEHSGRYDEFAKYMTQKGFVVWAHDHRQHGHSIGHDSLGIFNDEDTWENMVEDVSIVAKEFRQNFKNIPMFILGHSMGSLLLRSYLQSREVDVNGVIVMGSPITSVPLMKLGIPVAQLGELIKKGRPNKVIDQLALGSFNRSIKNPRTPYDWISHDNHIVDAYAKDSLCGYVYSPLFYKELARGGLIANNRKLMKKFPHIPTMFISGDMDPCGGNGQGVKRLSDRYTELGLKSQLLLMKSMRHEVLNEIERRTTFAKVSEWLLQQV